MSEQEALLVEECSKVFEKGVIRRTRVRAVDGVSLKIKDKGVFGLVGESGSGKTTLLKVIMGLVEPSGGHLRFQGREMDFHNSDFARWFRRQAQIVFQDPYNSLNPRKTVQKVLRGAASLTYKKAAERDDRVKEIMELVGLSPSRRYLPRLPHELSGGERQRVGIARALVGGATFIGADEPVSSLDVSIRAQILNLLQDLRSRLGLTMLFVSHDLAVVRSISDTVGVMYRGRMVEIGSVEEVFHSPLHPYTRALVESSPIPDPLRERARNRSTGIDVVVGPTVGDTGCNFYCRCLHRREDCLIYHHSLEPVDDKHAVACCLINAKMKQ